MTPADLDALVARLTKEADDVEGYTGEALREAANALVQLREEIVRLKDWQPEGNILDMINRIEELERDDAVKLKAANAWVSRAQTAEARIAALEAERDALHADAVAIFEWMNRKGGMGLDVHRRIDTFLATWSKP